LISGSHIWLWRKTNHTEENNITWVTDADYIDVGQSADIGDASELAFGSYLHTLRFFPKPLNKSCYELSVAPNVRYLLRLWFAQQSTFTSGIELRRLQDGMYADTMYSSLLVLESRVDAGGN